MGITPCKALVCLLTAFLVLGMLTHAALADTRAEQAYFSAGAGLHVLELPESSPFLVTGGREQAVDFLGHYDGKDEGASMAFTLGQALEHHFTELRGFIASYISRHTRTYREDPSPWTDIQTRFQDRHCPQGTALGECITPQSQQHLIDLIQDDPHVRAVGWIGKIDGASMPFGSAVFAWGDPIRIRTKKEVDYYGLDLLTSHPFVSTGPSLNSPRQSLYLGPSYKRVRQSITTFAYESNRPPTVNYLNLREDLDAAYYGGLLGTRMDLPLQPDWGLTLEGTLGGYYLDADYKGVQQTFISSGTFAMDENTNHRDSDTQWAVTFNVQASLIFSYSENVSVHIGAGIEYLSDVPVMRYATLGERFGPGDSHSPAWIDYSDAFGYSSFVNLELK